MNLLQAFSIVFLPDGKYWINPKNRVVLILCKYRINPKILRLLHSGILNVAASGIFSSI